jgi:hypothetical protein
LKSPSVTKNLVKPQKTSCYTLVLDGIFPSARPKVKCRSRKKIVQNTYILLAFLQVQQFLQHTAAAK